MRTAVLLAVLAAALCVDAFPTVAVVVPPLNQSDPTKGSGFNTYYAKWLEAAGLRVVPLLYDTPLDQVDILLSHINGVFFTGGSLFLKRNDTYHQLAKHVWDYSMASVAAGNPFPLWGTCMGFQEICILAANNNDVLDEGVFDSYYLGMPLELTLEAYTSKMLGGAPAQLIAELLTQNITANLHHDGVTPTTFHNNKKLKSFFKVLSTNKDRKGVEFVSTIEGRHAPIFAVQWHPERPPFVWNTIENAPHTESAIDASHWVGRAFARAVRANTNKFPTQADEDAANVWKQMAPTTGQAFLFAQYGTFIPKV